jgi:hypothetical protein
MQYDYGLYFKVASPFTTTDLSNSLQYKATHKGK